MKNNFTQALKELTGFDGEPELTQKTANREADSTIPSIDFETNAQEEMVVYKELTESASEESTHITSTMVIKGDIKSKDDIFVRGQIIGDVETTQNLHSSNLILGNVIANNMLMGGARLKGDIKLEGDLIIRDDSVIVGNITCENVDLSGKVKGNCDARGFAKINGSSYIAGNIVADGIATEHGAKIIGSVTTRTEDVDVDADFDFGGEF